MVGLIGDYRSGNGYSPDQAVIVDLSPHIEKLLQYEDISDDLSLDEEHRLVEFVKSCLEMSHDKIQKRYDHWKEADRAHDVYVPADATSFKEKAVIADTRAIADTVLTYQMAALTGRNPMFQLEGLNRKSRRSSSVLEQLLHQHMRRTAGEAHIAQMLQDGIKYGYAPTKVGWNNKEKTNNIVNFDPRRAFHDPRVQWGDWSSMQFMGFTSFASYSALVRGGLYPKLAKYPQLRAQTGNRKNGWTAHHWHKEEGRGLSIDPAESYEKSGSYWNLGDSHVVDEMWLNLAGYEIGVPKIDQIWLVVAVYDESVVIRFQLNPYGQQFPVVIGSLYHDVHKTLGQSLYDVMLPMHNVATWLLRSRIDNVQAALNNLIFVDPSRVNVKDLIDRNPWGLVTTLPGTQPGEGVHIAQVPDVTAGHWNDISALSDMKQRVSSASDAQQGMPTPDVRTATEIQRLSQLGSQRLGVLARIISATTMRPMVRMMVANLQDEISLESSVPLDPNAAPGILQPDIKEGYLDITEADLQGDIDYLVVDGTLPLEPTRDASTWMNILQVMNQTGLNMEYKTGRMAEEAIKAMGMNDLEQFRISDQERQQGPSPSQQLTLMEKARGASVQPQDSVMKDVEKGNLKPMSEMQ